MLKCPTGAGAEYSPTGGRDHAGASHAFCTSQTEVSDADPRLPAQACPVSCGACFGGCDGCIESGPVERNGHFSHTFDTAGEFYLRSVLARGRGPRIFSNRCPSLVSFAAAAHLQQVANGAKGGQLLLTARRGGGQLGALPDDARPRARQQLHLLHRHRGLQARARPGEGG